MSDLSSERSSIRTLPEQEALDMIVAIRAKRREAIISVARRKTAPKPKKDAAATLISKMSAADKAELLITLLIED